MVPPLSKRYHNRAAQWIVHKPSSENPKLAALHLPEKREVLRSPHVIHIENAGTGSQMLRLDDEQVFNFVNC